MNLLALDTSTEFLSLALTIDGKMFTHYQHTGATASQLVLPQIQAMLKTAGISLKDLDGIAFGAGPGAFTGVRIACGVAQGLGFGVNLPVVGINTLLAVAQASGADKVIVCLDARMGEIYHAAFEKVNNKWLETCETKVCKPEVASALACTASTITIQEKQWVGAGSGWAIYDEVLRDIYTEYLLEVMPTITPMATAILQLAQPIFDAGLAKPASEALPIYIRNRVALTTLERGAGLRL